MAIKYRIEYISTFYFDVLDVESNLKEYPQKAKRLFEKLDSKLLYLVEHPEMYPIYDDFPAFRRVVIEDYLVFYSINDNIIEIHRLICGRMNVIEQLGGDSYQWNGY